MAMRLPAASQVKVGAFWTLEAIGMIANDTIKINKKCYVFILFKFKIIDTIFAFAQHLCS